MKKALYYFISLVTICLLTGCNGGGRKQKRGDLLPTDTTEVSRPANTIKPVVNVYIENSGSMDGYVKGETDFEHAVYGYLSDIKITDIADDVNLFYINSKIIPYGNNIKDFIDKLEPSTFKNRGGNRGETDIDSLLKMILDKTNDNTVSILVSDCVFSPGKGKNASEYLVNQQIGIKTNVAEHIKRYPGTAFVIYRLNSQFNGAYYNCYNEKTQINDRRPFFIWLIGNVDRIKILSKKIPPDSFKGSGVTHSYTLLPLAHEIDYSVQLSPKFGNFKLSREKGKTKTDILNAERASKGLNKGKFMFSVGADFSDLQTLLGKEYLNNPDNYALTINTRPSDAFVLTISENTGTNSKYTHRIQLTATQKIPTGDVEIALVNKEPDWIKDKNDDSGLNIKADDAMDKTYGIKYLTGGIEDAYNTVLKEKKETSYLPYAKLKVKISK